MLSGLYSHVGALVECFFGPRYKDLLPKNIATEIVCKFRLLPGNKVSAIQRGVVKRMNEVPCGLGVIYQRAVGAQQSAPFFFFDLGRSNSAAAAAAAAAAAVAVAVAVAVAGDAAV